MAFITGLHHCVLVAPELDSAVATYAALLGRDPDWISAPREDGAATALFVVDHTAIEILAPVGEGATADKLRETITTDGPGLKSIAFAVQSLDRFHTLLSRRGLAPGDIWEREVAGAEGFESKKWRACRIPDDHTAGIKTFFVEEENRIMPKSVGGDCVHTMDHFVIATPNTERTVAHYGGRLGLDLRLDRAHPEWGTHFLFFKTGGLIFEIVKMLKDERSPDDPDKMYGLTWTVKDLNAARERLRNVGLSVSEIRNGRKPGSRVFTVRDGTLNVPTLFIAHEAR